MLSGFAAMGMEIVWLRHFSLLLGGFRAVFSLVLTIVLVGIGAGAAGRRDRSVVGEAGSTFDAGAGAARCGGAVRAGLEPLRGPGGRAACDWRDARRALALRTTPCGALVQRAADADRARSAVDPDGQLVSLANAVIQHAERAVGARAGALYLANTAGAVCGSLVAGYVLLPLFGMQGSATILSLAAALAILPLALTMERRGAMRAGVAAAIIPVLAIAVWLRLPPDYIPAALAGAAVRR